MNLFDIHGNSLISSVQSDSVFVDDNGATVQNYLYRNSMDKPYTEYPTLSTGLIDKIKANYAEFMGECFGDTDKIPLIVSTDQHGAITVGNDIFRLIGDIVDWDEVSAIINLGDTCYSQYTESEVKDYSDALKGYIPNDKRIEIYGNHDRWTGGNNPYSPYFKTTRAHLVTARDGYFTVDDPYYNLRYLAVNCMTTPWANINGELHTHQAKFIIDVLSRTDGMDVVMMSHIPLFYTNMVDRNGNEEDATELTFIADVTVQNSFYTMVQARKNKTSGTLVDSDGVSHSYDFSDCTSDLLMHLNGHWHKELTTTQYGLTEFVFTCFKDTNAFYFCYIDRKNKKFKAWRNVMGINSPWEIDIA